MTKRYRRSDVEIGIGKLIRARQEIIDLAIRWEKLRSPMRYHTIHGTEYKMTEAMWEEFDEVECALAEAGWKVTGKPSVPPEGWRSTFEVIEGGNK
jgi:hypothetical protein